MAERGVDVIKSLMTQGVMVKINDILDSDTAQLIAEEFGHTVTRVSEADIEEGLSSVDDKDEDKKPRSPVVTVMGHVDHGKTTLLDAIRESNNVSGEAGGITQHIGAYQTRVKDNKKITFIDTPGHAAFTSMRARGAKVTDIVVLVVAADDGVMPQTIEAINHAREAEAPIIVAINKIDKPDADPNATRNSLLQNEIVVEEMGGDIQSVELSALTKKGIDDLIEAILLQADLLELKANPDRPAEGFVIEAKLDKNRGPAVTTIIQRGTLRIGDILVIGQYSGKVRSLINDQGKVVKECYPGDPIEILGMSQTPEAGDILTVVESDSRAREVSEYRQRKSKAPTANLTKANLDQLFSNRSHEVYSKVSAFFSDLKRFLKHNKSPKYDFVYDQVVSYGELISTFIINSYFIEEKLNPNFIDARNCIKTDSKHREGNIIWDNTNENIRSHVKINQLNLTQGFIASDKNNFNVTLGREGSDYSAAIFAYAINAESLTIWKDVEGLLNGDPKYFKNTKLIKNISYSEAIELAF